MKTTTIATIVLAAIGLTGCAHPFQQRQAEDFSQRQVTSLTPFRGLNADADLALTTGEAVHYLLASLQVPLDQDHPVLVTTLSDVSDLDASSAFGRVISEQIVSSLVREGYSVPEIKLRRTLVVRNGGGEFMLSRDLAQLTGRSANATAVVTGTYSAGLRSVDVSLHVVRLTDGIIIGAFDYSLPNGSNTRSLLVRSAAQ